MANRYSINTENGKLLFVEVDGVRYDHPDQIPDPGDRAQILKLLANSTSSLELDVEQVLDVNFDQDFGEDFAAKIRELDRQSQQLPKLVGNVFLGVSLVLLSVTGVSSWMTLRAIANEHRAPGQVIDLIERRSWDQVDREYNTYYYPVVEFDVPNRSRQKVQIGEGSWPAAYAKGQAVIVLYDPAQPTQARIQSLSSTMLMWLLPTITGFMGLVFLTIAVGLRLGAKSTDSEA